MDKIGRRQKYTNEKKNHKKQKKKTTELLCSNPEGDQNIESTRTLPGKGLKKDRESRHRQSEKNWITHIPDKGKRIRLKTRKRSVTTKTTYNGR